MRRLDGRVAIVTGGAQGIGREIAAVFLEQGAKVAILDLDDEAGRRAASELEYLGTIRHIMADVSDEAAIERAVGDVAELFGGVDILVNSAVLFVLRGLDTTPEEWRRSLAINVMGPALMAKHVVPHMRRAGGGAIVNMGSVSAYVAQKGFLTYNCAKGAVTALTRCMALDLAADNIRVNQVNPTSTWTERIEKHWLGLGLTREDITKDPNTGALQMIKRPAEPREQANAVLFLVSDEASCTTGSQIHVDGGWLAQIPTTG